MRMQLEQAQQDVTAAKRIIMLPAVYTGPDDFVRAGFAQALRERSLQLDVALVDLNLMQLNDRTLLRRLRQEIVLPARAAGCRTVWLAGISLGGFIALTYAERYPGEIDGLCVLAPYLGNRIVTGEIAAAGGLDGWDPASWPLTTTSAVCGGSSKRAHLRCIWGSAARIALPTVIA